MTKLEVLSNIVDQCSKPQFESVFAPIADLFTSCNKVEMVSHCLNKEFGAYGFTSYTSHDKATVLINNEGICQVVDFLKGKGHQPIFTEEHIKQVETVVDFSDKGKVNIL